MIGLETLQNAIDYIESHLLDEISYEDVDDSKNGLFCDLLIPIERK